MVAMIDLKISVPEAVKPHLDEQVRRAGYPSWEAYILDLIRKDQIAQGEAELAAMLQEGIESGEAIPVNNDFWEREKAEVLKSL
jgi:antitoxin ParD1/3/4